MMDWGEFASGWCDAWNERDLARVLVHFADDVVFTSPVAAQLMPETNGRLIGKAALREYWEEGLRRIPDLHFRVSKVFGGVDTVVVQYQNQKGASVSEVLTFRECRVVEGHGTYEIGTQAAGIG